MGCKENDNSKITNDLIDRELSLYIEGSLGKLLLENFFNEFKISHDQEF